MATNPNPDLKGSILEVGVAEDDDVTVTSATLTPEEAATSLGVPLETKAEPAPKVEEPVVAAGDAPVVEDPVVAREADSPKPDPEVSEAARKLRGNRVADRVKGIREDCDLYEENIKLAGGNADDVYKIPDGLSGQAQIDAHSRRRNELTRLFSKTLKEAKTKPAPAAPVKAAAPAAEPVVAGDPDVKEPPFTFPPWEEYQEKHESATYEQYSDARQDARTDHKAAIARGHAAVKAERDRLVTQAQHYQDRETTFKASHADYDAVIAQAVPTEGAHPKQIAYIRDLIMESEVGPALLYHLGKNPASVQTLLAAENRAQMDRVFLRLELRVERDSTPATTVVPATAVVEPAAVLRPKPITASVPAPGAALPAGAPPAPTLNQIADSTEDADDYLATRYPARMQRG